MFNSGALQGQVAALLCDPVRPCASGCDSKLSTVAVMVSMASAVPRSGLQQRQRAVHAALADRQPGLLLRNAHQLGHFQQHAALLGPVGNLAPRPRHQAAGEAIVVGCVLAFAGPMAAVWRPGTSHRLRTRISCSVPPWWSDGP